MSSQPIKLFVPAEGALAHIARGSAIVGRDERDEHVHVYFEGNLYDAANLQRFIDRVAVAAGRLVKRYPTVAQALAPVDQLVEVGAFDVEANKVTVTNGAALAAWLGRSGDLPSEFGFTDTV